MNVKSVFTRLFTQMAAGRFLIMLLAFPAMSSFTEHPDRELMAKQANIIIRKIGHHLLLQTGDSTSRVLPVTEMKTGTFLLRFENEFTFHPDSLMLLTSRLLTKTNFPSGFTLTVNDCINKSIVYGFQVNRTSPDILSCQGRIHPPGCYTFEFTFPDFYRIEKWENAGAYQLTDTDVMAPGETLQKTTFDDSLNKLNKNSSPGRSDVAKSREKAAAIKTRGVSYNLLSAGVLALLVIAFLIGRFGKRFQKTPVANQANPTQHEQLPGLPRLGAFMIDVKGRRLLLGDAVTGLTEKECKVLELLHNNFGELIQRDTLLQDVWIKEGVITGRSLDMFVSKLRKKLSADPGLVITNVHGKGYKLERSGQDDSARS